MLINVLIKLVAHSLRPLDSTTINEHGHGHDPDVIEASLAHVDKNEVRRAYNRAEYLELRRVLMCWWPEHIDAATSGKKVAKNIVQYLHVGT